MVMKFDEIYRSLERVGALVKGWEKEGISEAERDLALENLRRVYEQIKFAPAVAHEEKHLGAEELAGDDSSVVEEPLAVEEDTPPPFTEQSLFDLNEVTVKHTYDRSAILSLYGDDDQPAKQEDKEPEPVEIPEDIIIPVVETPAPEEEQASEQENIPEPEEIPAAETESPREEEKVPAQEEIPAAEPEAPKANKMAEIQPKKVLGDVINSGGQVLGESVSFAAGRRDMATKIASGTVSELNKAIALNDKFQIARDLFRGDMEALNAAISKLDSFTDLDEAMIYIAENFSWDADDQSARMVVDLLERKLS